MTPLTTVKTYENLNGYKVLIQKYLVSDTYEYQYKIFDEDGDSLTEDGYATKSEAIKAAKKELANV